MPLNMFLIYMVNNWNVADKKWSVLCDTIIKNSIDTRAIDFSTSK